MKMRIGDWVGDLLERDATAARRGELGSQMVEFAVTLPLLVVFVVGIFDFSGAFTLKQKLTNVARTAARAAAAEPSSDLGKPLPISVSDAFYTIDTYLKANQINDCGIAVGNVAAASPVWTFTKSGGGCTGSGLTITINRGYYYPATASAQPATSSCTHQAVTGQIAVIATCVSIQYGYPWRFGQAASLLGSTTALPSTLIATAVAMNEN